MKDERKRIAFSLLVERRASVVTSLQQLPQLVLLLLLAAALSSSTPTPRVAHAWVATAPIAMAARLRSSMELSARERRQSTSALASSLSAPPPDSSTTSLWGDSSSDSSSLSSSSSSSSSRTTMTSEQQDKEENPSPSQHFTGPYLDPAIVKETVASVFSSSAADSSDTTDNDNNGPIYLFDGLCNFCDATVHFCFDHDPAARLRFCPLQSPTGRALLQHFGRHPDDTSSLVLVEDATTAHFGSDAVLQTAVRLSGLPGVVRAGARQLLQSTSWVPPSLRDAVYRLVSEHRHVLMGTASDKDGPQCRVDLDHTRFVDEVVFDAEQ